MKNKIRLTGKQYETMVEDAHRVVRATTDVLNFDRKTKFTQLMYVPTIREIEALHLDKETDTSLLMAYIKYFIYFVEPGICPVNDDPIRTQKLQKLRTYLKKYFLDNVYIT